MPEVGEVPGLRASGWPRVLSSFSPLDKPTPPCLPPSEHKGQMGTPDLSGGVQQRGPAPFPWEPFLDPNLERGKDLERGVPSSRQWVPAPLIFPRRTGQLNSVNYVPTMQCREGRPTWGRGWGRSLVQHPRRVGGAVCLNLPSHQLASCSLFLGAGLGARLVHPPSWRGIGHERGPGMHAPWAVGRQFPATVCAALCPAPPPVALQLGVAGQSPHGITLSPANDPQVNI